MGEAEIAEQLTGEEAFASFTRIVAERECCQCKNV
jgi:hypothetical protein